MNASQISTPQSACTSPRNHPAEGEWVQPLGRWVSDAPTEGPDGDVYVTTVHHKVYRLDGDTGEVEWCSDVGHSLHGSPRVLPDGTVLLRSHWVDRSDPPDEDSPLPELTSLDETIALDGASGQVKWSHRMSGKAGGTWNTPDGKLLAISSENRFQALDASTGEVLWTYPGEVNPYRFEPQVAADGSLYVVGEGSDEVPLLSKLDPETGTEMWSYRGAGLELQLSPAGSPVVTSNKWTDSGRIAFLHSLDSETGKQSWKLPLVLGEQGSRSLLQGPGEAVLTRRWESWEALTVTLESWDRSTGELRWEKELPPIGGVQTGASGELLVHTYKVGDDGAYGFALQALDADTGERLWSLETDHGLRVETMLEGLWIALGTRFNSDTGLEKTVITALDPETGQPRWEHETGKSVWSLSPTEAGDKLCLDVEGCKLLCLDLETGEPAWSYRDRHFLHPTEGSSKILVSNLQGQVVAVKPEGSGLVEEGDPFPFPGEEPSGPTVIGGFSDFPIVEGGTKQVLGQERAVLAADFDWNGQLDGWDYVLVRDRDGDGVLTDRDLAELPTWEELQALDRDGDGQLIGAEAEEAALFLWRDSDQDGTISEDDFHFALVEPGRLGMVDLERKVVSQAYARECGC